MIEQLDLVSPAKINLFLELIEKREDGFHELETVMSCVDLCDQLSFRVRQDAEIQLNCGQDSMAGLPSAADNLIVKALDLLNRESGVSRGMDVRLLKKIPIQAGLGGASSNAATALIAGNRLWQLGFTQTQLLEFASELGSDVPFFVQGGSAVCRGRGEIVQSIPWLPSFSVLIAKPPVGLSTPQVFSRCSIPAKPRSSNELLESLRTGNVFETRKHILNRLEPAAAEITGWVNRMRQAFEDVNSFAHQLSGSGSCYFGLFSNMKLLRKAQTILLQREPEIAVYCCKTAGRLAQHSLGME